MGTVTISHVRKMYGAVQLAGQNVVALFRERAALSPGIALPSRPISNESTSSTAKAASGLSLLRTG